MRSGYDIVPPPRDPQVSLPLIAAMIKTTTMMTSKMIPTALMLATTMG